MLRSRSFWIYQAIACLSMCLFQINSVAGAWRIYTLTGRPFDLGLVGLAQFVPPMLLFPYAGWLADHMDRRLVLAGSFLISSLGSLALALIPNETPWAFSLILSLLGVLSAAKSLEAPSLVSLLPLVVGEGSFTRAVAGTTTLKQVAKVSGPVIAGALCATSLGWQLAHFMSAVGAIISLGLLLGLRYQNSPQVGTTAFGFADTLSGMSYLFKNKVLLGACSLDLVAVLLGGSVALFPVYANEVLAIGPTGLGLLRAMPAAGAILMGAFLAARPIRDGVGPVLFLSVFVYGLATILFALSTSLNVSLMALLVLGAADAVSVVIRQTLIQLHAPPEIRGRVTSSNQVFVVASNQLGEFESGLVAQWLGPVTSVALGGALTCLISLTWPRAFPALLRLEGWRGTARSAAACA